MYWARRVDPRRGFGNPSKAQPGALGCRSENPIVKKARGAIRLAVEGDEQGPLAREIEPVTIDIRRLRQSRKQVVGEHPGLIHRRKITEKAAPAQKKSGGPVKDRRQV